MDHQEYTQKIASIRSHIVQEDRDDSEDSNLTQDQLISTLSQLAVALREASIRIPAGQTDLPSSLSTLLKSDDISERPPDELVQQVGRVAANLVVDCDPNRDTLVEAGYVDQLLFLLKSHLGDRYLTTGSLKALIASLLNLAVDGHGPTISALSNQASLETLLSLALLPQSTSEEPERFTIVQWIWKIVSTVAMDESFVIVATSELLAHTVAPLSLFMPENVSTTDPDTYSDHLQILLQACTTIEAFTKDSKQSVVAFTTSAPDTALHRLVHFLESGGPPSSWEYASDESTPNPEDEDDESITLEDCNKAIGQGKTSIVRAVVALSSDIGHTEVPWFWTTMYTWLQDIERSDLVCCALLSFGNRAQEDTAAQSLLPQLLPFIQPLLISQPPVIVQHAIIGLLRNLSIPDKNKTILGDAGVIESVIGMGAWKEERDMVGSVQGGAVALVKSLCKTHALNSIRFISNKPAITQLLSLMKRSDDLALKSEATRIFCNAVRSLARQPEDLQRLCEEDVVGWIAELLRTGGKFPILVNEAIVSLALLATFGKDGTTGTIINALLRSIPSGGRKEGDQPEEEEIHSTALDALAQVLQGKSEVSQQLQSNALTLLHQISADDTDAAIMLRRQLSATIPPNSPENGWVEGLAEVLRGWTI